MAIKYNYLSLHSVLGLYVTQSMVMTSWPIYWKTYGFFLNFNIQHTKLVYITVVVFYERQRNVHSITKWMQTYIVTTDISWNLVYLAIQYIVQEKNKCRYIISIDQ